MSSLGNGGATDVVNKTDISKRSSRKKKEANGVFDDINFNSNQFILDDQFA